MDLVGKGCTSLTERQPPAMNNPDRGVCGWLSVRRCCSDCVSNRESIVPVVLTAAKFPQHVPTFVISLIMEVDMRDRGGYKSYYDNELKQPKANDTLSVRLVEVKKPKGSGESQSNTTQSLVVSGSD